MMPQIILPSWDNLNEIVTTAEDRVLICSPYYSSSGIGNIFDSIGDANRFQFWTRLSPSDWVAGATSPKDLLTLADILQQGGRIVELAAFQRLHAKAYVADYSLALIGSPNLSEGGFRANLELVVRFEGEEALSAINVIEESIAPRLQPLNIESFREWIQRFEPTILQIRARPDDSAEDLQEAQRSLDEILGYGHAAQENRQIDEFSHHDFGEWLDHHPELPGAEMLSDRYHNTSGQNLTGHFKQSFYAVLGFLFDHGEYTNILVEELAQLDPGSVYQVNPDVLDSWLEYFNNHATQVGTNYNFAVLRGYLPPSVGGTRHGGGGGISTFKRMLPLCAKYLSEDINGN
jgi:HKD family nuclease